MNSNVALQAVVVTQDTSHFAELMLRTLFATNDLNGFDFAATILDNSSSDQHLDGLRAFGRERGVLIIGTAFQNYVAAELHGTALTRFVQEKPDCTHYLFLDADMWFVEPDTIATMVNELRAAPADTFAMQARIYGYYAGFVYEGSDGVPGTNAFDHIPTWPIEFEGRTYANRYAPRCSPVCSLVANTPLFRDIVGAVGLSQAISFRVGEVVYYDTFGLMTQVMATHGQQFAVSSKTVNHFTQTTYLNKERADRDRDCLLMLEELRAGRGLSDPIFRRPAGEV